MGTFGDRWAPLRAYGGLLGPMGAYAGPLAPLGTYGHLWGPMGAYGDLWAPPPFFLPLSLLTHFPHFPILVFKVLFTFVLPCF